MSASSIKGLNYSCLSGIFPSMWILDSEASYHMLYVAISFMSLNTSPYISVMTIDGTHMPLAGIGSVSTPNLSFSDVYCIPNLTLSLAICHLFFEYFTN